MFAEAMTLLLLASLPDPERRAVDDYCGAAEDTPADLTAIGDNGPDRATPDKGNDEADPSPCSTSRVAKALGLVKPWNWSTACAKVPGGSYAVVAVAAHDDVPHPRGTLVRIAHMTRAGEVKWFVEERITGIDEWAAYRKTMLDAERVEVMIEVVRGAAQGLRVSLVTGSGEESFESAELILLYRRVRRGDAYERVWIGAGDSYHSEHEECDEATVHALRFVRRDLLFIDAVHRIAGGEAGCRPSGNRRKEWVTLPR